MPTGPNSIDDEEIRKRCASIEAATYTLYVRNLIRERVPGGQAEILRVAAERGLLPVGYKRQTLSEHLSGRYRHGPPWSTTEMIIECLPDHLPKGRIREEADDLHWAARQRPRQHQNVPDMVWLEEPPDGPRWERHQNSAPGRHAGPVRSRPHNTVRIPGGTRPGGNAATEAYRPAVDRAGVAADTTADTTAEIADLRAECARLAVQAALASARELDPTRYANLSGEFASYQRSRLGQLSDGVDSSAPVMWQALARYLCAYAELGQTTVREMAVRTGLSASAVADLLAARRAPTDSELHRLSVVLGADDRMVWHLAAHARSETRAQGTEGGHPEPA